METQSKQMALSLINQKLRACNERTLFLPKKKVIKPLTKIQTFPQCFKASKFLHDVQTMA